MYFLIFAKGRSSYSLPLFQMYCSVHTICILDLWKQRGIIYKLPSAIFFSFAERDMLSVLKAILGNQTNIFLHVLALYLFSLLITCMLYIYSIFFWNHTLKLRKNFDRIFIDRDEVDNNEIFCKALLMQKYQFTLQNSKFFTALS